MLLRLAWTSLTMHRARTLLAMLGVAVSAAMLLDMVMLSSGMRESFRSLLTTTGYQIRLAPHGTLPFDTDASMEGGAGLVDSLRRLPGVAAVSPVLGGQVHVMRDSGAVSAFALGGVAAVQGDYDVVEGRAPKLANEMVASADFLAAAGARVGDTVRAAAGYDPELRGVTGLRSLVIVGRAHFIYTPAGQRAVALPLGTLQGMEGAAAADRISLAMVRADSGVDVEQLRLTIERMFPRVSAISTETALQQVDQRLSYFRQLALILGIVSLVVGFLLVTTMVTVSVNERLGEIVVMRAIGVARLRVVWQVVLEGVVLMVTGAAVGLGLGLVTGEYLNGILSGFPGLPAEIRFFVFAPHDAWTALGLLVGAGLLAGVYPAWRGASLPIATTLREEAI
jgi:putative ABC transport system permease protein